VYVCISVPLAKRRPVLGLEYVVVVQRSVILCVCVCVCVCGVHVSDVKVNFRETNTQDREKTQRNTCVHVSDVKVNFRETNKQDREKTQRNTDTCTHTETDRQSDRQLSRQTETMYVPR
jgi:hypothetical protein